MSLQLLTASDFSTVELSDEEILETEGGVFLAPFLAIGAAAAAGVAIYEAGKAAGEFIYYATHKK
ncbi:class IIb bacteriocin, lactobin A/cerein 7B family [Hymenobacter latericus]|uniref:class IIb bacteriocin, lactobin A/cerein 7B family n=1 Tax=Hymenobacter sp. YIM 151858-1 TaxID=2987688 RepID=UPI0022261ACA|nr:class IIb bacteriocin, lactobin A/cerein 7B family [Hymenobacter sp. YIM 151858-1]UYZ58729.1 class IIb bacteriocin, lactobin A/cerein 7B family [Hymenobacter sp. YIM 151858-1]